MPGLLASALRRRAVLRAALASVAAAAVAAIVVAAHPWPRHGADQIRHLVKWPACAAVTVKPAQAPVRWRHAEEHAIIDCEMLGPWVAYARFNDRQALRADLLAASPASAVCIYGGGTEVAVNGLEAHQFPALCHQLTASVSTGSPGCPTSPAGPPSTATSGRRNARHAVTCKPSTGLSRTTSVTPRRDSPTGIGKGHY
jgi:hypothetical protein